MINYFWHIIQMPESRHTWGQLWCRGSPAQVRHRTSLFFRGWATGVKPRLSGPCMRRNGLPEPGWAIKPCPSWGSGINRLEPRRVGSCLSCRAQLSRPALLKCIIAYALYWRPLIWEHLPRKWPIWIQIPPQSKKIQTVTPRRAPKPREHPNYSQSFS